MKAEKSRVRRLGYLTPLFLGTGLFLCCQLYQKWDTYHMLGRTVMGCLGAFFLFLPFSKKFCALVAEILLLSVVFSAVSPAFHNVWTGSASFTVKDLPSFLLSILTFAIPLLLFAISLFLKFRRNSISLPAVDLMSGSEFEQFCADVLRKNGFHNVELMGGSGDQGVDIVATKKKLRYAIQCKCYSNNLGNTPVQEVFAGRVHYGCNVAAVMTNSYFTAGAIELASSTGVLLWDRDWVNDHLLGRKRKSKEILDAIPNKGTPLDERDMEPEPVIECAGNEDIPAEILSEEIKEFPAGIKKAKQEEEREKEKQERYLRNIYGEELKWRREQLHGDSDEDRQE